eukprot:tig00021493_g21878.t1
MQPPPPYAAEPPLPTTPAALVCPVCLSLLESAVQTSCGHAACARCLLQSMQASDKCPVCRRTLDLVSPSFALRQLCADYRGPDAAQEEAARALDAEIAAYFMHDQPPTPAGAPAPYGRQRARRPGPEASAERHIMFFLFMAIAYVLSPIDLLPEFLLPGVGFIDDLVACVIALLLLAVLIRDCAARRWC